MKITKACYRRQDPIYDDDGQPTPMNFNYHGLAEFNFDLYQVQEGGYITTVANVYGREYVTKVRIDASEEDKKNELIKIAKCIHKGGVGGCVAHIQDKELRDKVLAILERLEHE